MLIKKKQQRNEKMETPRSVFGWKSITKEGNGTLEQQSYKTCDLEKRAMLVLLEHLRKKKKNR